MFSRRSAVVVLAVLVAGLGAAAAEATSTRQPAGRYSPHPLPPATPEQQGMDSWVLAQGIDFLLANRASYRIHSVVVVRNGTIVLDAGFFPFSLDSRHDLASVTKSVLSTIVGLAIDEGHIAGVDEPVVDFFPDLEIQNLDGRKRAMTIEDLLTMRSGLDCDPMDGEATLREMMASPDWVQFALDLPMTEEPGASYVYCSPNVHLLSAIVQRATGMSTLEFASEHLFGPMGYEDVVWPTDPQGIHRGWGDLNLRPMDMTMLGYLYLMEGSWLGDQVLSSWWTGAATQPIEGLEFPWLPEGEGYSYLWYYTAESFNAAGRGGQKIYVWPDEDLVVGLNAGGGPGDYAPIVSEFLGSYVLGAVESAGPLPPDPEGYGLLRSATSAAAASDQGPPQPVPTLPATALAISGQTYGLEPNPYEFSWLRLSFPGGDEALFEFGLPELSGGPQIAPRVGLDDVYRFSPGRWGALAGAKGQWETDSRFVLLFDEIGNINLWQMSMVFEDDAVTVEMEGLAGGLPGATLTGTAQARGIAVDVPRIMNGCHPWGGTR